VQLTLWDLPDEREARTPAQPAVWKALEESQRADVVKLLARLIAAAIRPEEQDDE
jgi:hypothetical protein